MIKIKIYIKNESEYLDKDVNTIIKLPSVPREGEILYLDEKALDKLHKKARKNTDIAWPYAPQYFYGKSSRITDPKEKNLSDLGFDDCIWVDSVCYMANEDVVHVVITHDYYDDRTSHE